MSARPERTGIMLAHPATPRRIKQLGTHCIVQPKLNGERCWVEWYNKDTPTLISSYGNEFKLPHITQALIDQGFQGLRADGELYIHGEPFEEIHSIASASRKDLHPRYREMEFHIFDFKCTEGRPQLTRSAVLQELSTRPPLYTVQAYVIETKDWQDWAEEFVRQQYEGIILRDLRYTYVEARTPALLKFKPTFEDIYRIVDVAEGIGWCTEMLGSFILEAHDQPGAYFRVGSGKLLTKSQRQALWKERMSLPGKLLRIKHEGLKTSGGLPKCAVALEILDPKNKNFPQKG